MVLTLSGVQISAMTRFDGGTLPRFGPPATLADWAAVRPRSNFPRFTPCANADQAGWLILSSFFERSLESRTPTKPVWPVHTSTQFRWPPE
jgi:hypothetical protein